MKSDRYLTKITTIFLTLIILLTHATSFDLFAKTYRAAQSGDWEDPATWGSEAPTTEIVGDRIVIPDNVTVVLNSDLMLFKQKSKLEVDGELQAEDFNIELIGAEVSGSGKILVGGFFIFDDSKFEFEGHMFANTFSSSTKNIDLRANLDISEELIVRIGYLNIQDGHITLNDDAILVVNSASLTGEENITINGMYNLVYTGASNRTGFELMPENLATLECSLNSEHDILHLSRDLNMKGNVIIKSGIFDISDRKLVVDGDVDCVDKGVMASNFGTVIILRGRSELAFSPTKNSVRKLSISGDRSKVAVKTPLYVENLLDLSQGKMKGNDNVFINGHYTNSSDHRFKPVNTSLPKVIQ